MEISENVKIKEEDKLTKDSTGNIVHKHGTYGYSVENFYSRTHIPTLNEWGTIFYTIHLDYSLMDMVIKADKVYYSSDDYNRYHKKANLKRGVIGRNIGYNSNNITPNQIEEYRKKFETIGETIEYKYKSFDEYMTGILNPSKFRKRRHSVFALPKYEMLFDVNDYMRNNVDDYLYPEWEHPLLLRTKPLHQITNIKGSEGGICTYLSNCMSVLFYDYFYEKYEERQAVEKFREMLVDDEFQISDLILLSLSIEAGLKWDPSMENFNDIDGKDSYHFVITEKSKEGSFRKIDTASVVVERKVFDRVAKRHPSFFKEYIQFHYPPISSSSTEFATNTSNSIIVGLDNYVPYEKTIVSTSHDIIDLTLDTSNSIPNPVTYPTKMNLIPKPRRGKLPIGHPDFQREKESKKRKIEVIELD